MFTPPGDCPVCGVEVHTGARACPECGADDRSGWRGFDSARKAFDYEEFLEEEFGKAKDGPKLKLIWWITALVLLLGTVWLLLREGSLFN